MPSKRTQSAKVKVNLLEIIEKFLMQHQASGWSPITVHAYRRILQHFRLFLLTQNGSEDIGAVTSKVAGDYADRIQEFHFSQEEKNQWLSRLKIFFRWLCEEGLLSNPFARIRFYSTRPKRIPSYITQHEVATFLDSVSVDTSDGLRDRALLELLYSCGLRRAEICKLKLADINFTDRTLRVLEAKGGKDRMVPVGKVALFWIQQYLQEAHSHRLSDPLFYHPGRFHAIAGWYVAMIICKYKTANGFSKPSINVRSFRHSFAIHLLENGASIRHIQQMMGHSSLRTTQKYTCIMPAELKRAHTRAHPSERNRLILPCAKPSRLTKKY